MIFSIKRIVKTHYLFKKFQAFVFTKYQVYKDGCNVQGGVGGFLIHSLFWFTQVDLSLKPPKMSSSSSTLVILHKNHI